MTDEQKWLLLYGRRWVDWWELEEENGEISPVFERLSDANKLKQNASTLRVRLKTKEENESISV